MEEVNNESPQFKYDEMCRPFNNFGNKHYNNDFDWKKHGPGMGMYGPKWQGGYGGSFFPGNYGSYYPGNYDGFYGWPWFLLALKSLSPRDLARYMDEMNGIN